MRVVRGKKVPPAKHIGSPGQGRAARWPRGPGLFNLGNVVLRAAIYIDPHTAQVTEASDGWVWGFGPPILHGIPLQIGHVNVTIDRVGGPLILFNPTSCNPMSITGTIIGAEGASSPVSVPFQVANCAMLAFKPVFTASTQGKTSKADGASLHVKLVAPHEGPQVTTPGNASGTGTGTGTGSGSSGSSAQTEEANISRVKHPAFSPHPSCAGPQPSRPAAATQLRSSAGPPTFTSRSCHQLRRQVGHLPQLADRGRPTAVKTFTRHNNHRVTARKGRQARPAVTTQPSCVAHP